MANLIRSAKSGSDRSTNELAAYKIFVASLNPESLSGKPLPTDLSGIDPFLLTADVHTEGLSDETLCMLQYLNLATKPNTGQQSAIHDFAKELLLLLGYRERGLVLRSRYAIPFTIGDNNRSVQPDTCLVQGSTIIPLILQTSVSPKDPEAQVIAEAIAAFQLNNRNRNRARLIEPELDHMDIPVSSWLTLVLSSTLCQ